MTKIETKTERTLSAKSKAGFSLFISILLILQPFLDNYYLYTDEVSAKTFGFTLPPILVVLAVFAVAVYYFIKYRGGSIGKILFVYLVICAIYFVLHHLNCVEFNSYVEGDFHYSMIHEAYYVARLLVPMLLIYVVYEIGYNTGDFLNVSCIMSAICGLLLLVTNIVGIGLCSYTNEAIIGNIFTWKTILTTEDLLPKYYASKAFFSYANQISVVLTGLFPLVCYKVAKSPKWYNIANAIVLTLAMLTLGTMTATIGAILEIACLAVLVVLYFLFNIKKIKTYKKNIIAAGLVGVLIIGILAGLAPISPAIRNMNMSQKNNLGNKMEHFSLDMSNSEMTDDQYREYCEFVLYNYEAAGIAWRYVYVYYPYELDPAFWVAMIRNYTVGDNQNYRSLETRLIQRITDIDGSKWNPLLGISATRETNIIKIERDITAQYYSMGILGVVLFFGLYFVVILIAIVSVLKSMFRKKKFPLFQVVVAMSFCVMMVMGYYCGNSLDMTFLSTYLGVSCGVLFLTSVKPEGQEATSFSKGLYYLNRVGFKKTLELVRESNSSNVHEKECANAAIEAFPAQLEEIKSSLSGKNVFVFTPTVEWNYLYQRCHQLATCYSKRENCAVVFLTSQKQYDDNRKAEQIKPSLWLVNANLANRIDELTVDSKCVISCIYNITSGTDCLNLYHSDKTVYEYVDDLRFIVSGANDFEQYKLKHENLLKTADVSVATARALFDEIKPVAKNALMLPNAADYEFFSSESEADAELKSKVEKFDCVIEYYGALASWFDFESVKKVAEKHPEWAFVLIGKKIGNDMEQSGIESLKNIIYIPAVPYDTLPGYIACADIMSIPFVINETTLATSPVKLFEYMASHKPIVTSEMPECVGYKSVSIYKNAEEFEEEIKVLIENKGDKALEELLDKEAKENTWESRASAVVNALEL